MTQLRRVTSEWSKRILEYVQAFFSFYVDHTLDESRVLPTVEDITGSPPRTFEQRARVHAEAFRSVPSSSGSHLGRAPLGLQSPGSPQNISRGTIAA
jgi:hypothetical protein